MKKLYFNYAPILLTYFSISLNPSAAAGQSSAVKIQESCLAYDHKYSEAPLFSVKPKTKDERIHFHSKKSSEISKAYLVSGDVVFAGPEDKGYRCVYYGNNKGILTPGFIPDGDLEEFPEREELTKAFLLGVWSYNGNPKIVISDAGESLVKAAGEAKWQGLSNFHTGEFSAAGSIKGSEIEFRESKDEFSCVVKAKRRGPYLVVNDNGNCGGMNVSFSSILMKLK